MRKQLEIVNDQTPDNLLIEESVVTYTFPEDPQDGVLQYNHYPIVNQFIKNLARNFEKTHDLKIRGNRFAFYGFFYCNTGEEFSMDRERLEGI